ncbi:hypothetical protein [Cellulosimicrobium sp. NPDC057862]|uniref:hypothetical protein n=1 Tax=Actinomycetes TaxID=1760 RepID=UPI00366F6279
MITARIATAIENPLNGVLPDFTIFGAEFTQLWQKLIAGVWALGLIAAVVFLILGIVEMGKAGASENPNQHKEGRKKFITALIALGLLAALAVIVGAVLTFFG